MFGVLPPFLSVVATFFVEIPGDNPGRLQGNVRRYVAHADPHQPQLQPSSVICRTASLLTFSRRLAISWLNFMVTSLR